MLIQNIFINKIFEFYSSYRHKQNKCKNRFVNNYIKQFALI